MLVKEAILHIFDPKLNEPVYSKLSLDLSDEKLVKYLMEIIEKTFNSKKLRQAQLDEEASFTQRMIDLAHDFQNASRIYAGQIFGLMGRNPDIPLADLLFVHFALSDGPYLACFKLNHQPHYTHLVDQVEAGLFNQLLLHQTVLPLSKQAVDECFMFAIDRQLCFYQEKKHFLEETGEKETYFSSYFLKIEGDPTLADQIRVVKRAVEKTSKLYNDEAYTVLARAKEETVKRVIDSQMLDQKDLASAIFPKEPAKQQTYLKQTAEMGLPERSVAPSSGLTSRMNRQKLQFANGIELLVPLELFNDPDIIEIKNKPDGTVDILVKNIESIKNMF